MWGAFIHLILRCWEIPHDTVCVNPQRALFNVWMRADCTWVSFLLTNRVVIVWFFFTLHSLAVVLITIAHISRGSCFAIRSFSSSLHLLDMFRLSDTIKRECGNVGILVTKERERYTWTQVSVRFKHLISRRFKKWENSRYEGQKERHDGEVRGQGAGLIWVFWYLQSRTADGPYTVFGTGPLSLGTEFWILYNN